MHVVLLFFSFGSVCHGWNCDFDSALFHISSANDYYTASHLSSPPLSVPSVVTVFTEGATQTLITPEGALLAVFRNSTEIYSVSVSSGRTLVLASPSHMLSSN